MLLSLSSNDSNLRGAESFEPRLFVCVARAAKINGVGASDPPFYLSSSKHLLSRLHHYPVIYLALNAPAVWLDEDSACDLPASGSVEAQHRVTQTVLDTNTAGFVSESSSTFLKYRVIRLDCLFQLHPREGSDG